ncbi:hypothetical protein ABZ249_20695 [Nocardiopsis sp. NPDC006139]|uniref:hypothetical protein n=1 Tax=Nocardiopsis sp. NPDC006139 TaxID=3154578 RepID=UPI0033AD6744
MTPAPPERRRPLPGVGDHTARTVLAVSGAALLGSVLYDLALVFPPASGAPLEPGGLTLVLMVLLASWTTLAVRLVHAVRAPGSRPRDARTDADLRRSLLFLALCAANAPVALWITALRDALVFSGLLLFPWGAAVWALVLLLRGRRDAEREPVAAPPEAPKLIGLRDPARMPSGWSPVVFHARGGFAEDPPLEVDGGHVGFLASGGTLVVGLPPGAHTVRVQRRGSPPCPFSVVPGGIVHFTVTSEPNFGPHGPGFRILPHVTGPTGGQGPA